MRAYEQRILKNKWEYYKLKGKKDGLNQSDIHDLHYEFDCINGEKKQLITSYYLGLADKFSIEVPPINNVDIWEPPNQYCPDYVLTTNGIQHIKMLIREEEKYLREKTAYYANYLIALLGLVVAVLAILI